MVMLPRYCCFASDCFMEVAARYIVLMSDTDLAWLNIYAHNRSMSLAIFIFSSLTFISKAAFNKSTLASGSIDFALSMNWDK